MQTTLITVFLFLLLLPTVSASYFTGNFNDHGEDIDSDGLFDYLTVRAETYIDKLSSGYEFFGMLQDSEGNVLESRTCEEPSFTGKQYLELDFSGTQLYRKKVNGPYTLKYIEISPKDCGGGGMAPPMPPESSLHDAYTTGPYLYSQFQSGEPAVYCESSPCVASSSLIGSRDNINIPEPNSPNTIDSCKDGGAGSYLHDESIESITATSLGSGFFKAGGDVDVEVQVYCSSPMDKLNLVYSNDIDDIEWEVKETMQCSSTKAMETMSASFFLDDNAGEHAIRCVFGQNLGEGEVCGDDNYDDNDDIVIYVKECNSAGDCQKTECDHLDSSAAGCYGGTYRDYSDMLNECKVDFTCTKKTCTSYSEIITDNDGDGYDTECDNDCDDSNPDASPGAEEICYNGIDDDCNGYTDMDDPECMGKHMISLKKGWNLVSIPVISSNKIIENPDLSNANVNKIAALKKGEWKLYDGTSNSNLEELFNHDGFWISLEEDTPILVDDAEEEVTSFSLARGWNLIGYPSFEEKDIMLLFSDVMDNILKIYVYDGEFRPFNPKNPSSITIGPGAGIFVMVSGDETWHFDGVYKKSKQSFKLEIPSGWSLISLPLAQEDTVSEVFGGNNLYYLEDGLWKDISGSSTIPLKYSYWIDSPGISADIEGYLIHSLDIEINKGWNTISFPRMEEKGAGELFYDVKEDIDLVETFEDGEWKVFSPSRPPMLNSLISIKPGDGIFVKARNSAEWRFEGDHIERRDD
ncbi:putative metal-binding motif-containing protein [Candidatus Woesearchaeota archaeon]|nr:putative metal-binding motif-containing protein [Candidatus Woesearchaeota archaeon]